MMNYCLAHPCPYGFAFHHKYPIQIDYSGAFRLVDIAWTIIKKALRCETHTLSMMKFRRCSVHVYEIIFPLATVHLEELQELIKIPLHLLVVIVARWEM